MVGADASHGLRKSVATIAANPALTLSWLPTYLSLDESAENGVIGPNIVFQGANVHVRSTTSDGDGTGTGNLIVGWDELGEPTPSATATTTWSAVTRTASPARAASLPATATL